MKLNINNRPLQVASAFCTGIVAALGGLSIGDAAHPGIRPCSLSD